MKKLFFVFFLISSFVFAQKVEFTGKLLDKITNEPVVYANLSFLNSEKGVSTTEQGDFLMYINQKDLNAKIHISCLNYKDTIISALALQKATLFLQPKTEVLNEIILSRKLEKSVVLDPVKKGIISMHSRGLRMIAKYFPNTKKNTCCSYLTKVTIEFPRRINKKSKFRFRIFDVDEATGKPLNDLLLENIPVTIREDQIQVELDITDHNIKMPEKGFFVAFEKLFIPFNKYGKGDSTEEGFYSPVIGVTKSRAYKKVNRNYIYTRGQWMELPFTKRGRLKGHVPSISVTLSN
ncbi:MAG: hypothetical protein JXR05_13945 [Flavobacteriaceae bacterium]